MTNVELHKIMLVEDEEDIRTVAKFALELNGKFTVKYCNSGQEAINSVKAFSPDLIVLDVMMPEMDGIETFQALRQMRDLDHIPVVFMTAKAQSDEVAQYRKLGVTDVIIKPFDAMTLSDTLNAIWGKYHEKCEHK